MLDAVDPIKGEYLLEVSTPGIDRPLTRLKDFETYEGLEARLELDRLAEGRKRFRGTLAGVEDGNIGIDLDDESDVTVYVPFAWIVEAKLYLSEALLKRGAEERAARIRSESQNPSESWNCPKTRSEPMATGISANRLELLQIADAVAREKSIDKEIVIASIEEAIQKAARSRYGAEHDIRVHIDPKTGEMTIKRCLTVVDIGGERGHRDRPGRRQEARRQGRGRHGVRGNPAAF